LIDSPKASRAARPGPIGPEAAAAVESTWLFVPLAALAIATFVGVAVAPYLLVKAPLLLIALSPLSRHLVVASPAIDAVPFFLVAVSRMFLGDPFVYTLGRRYGPRALVWIEARSLSATRWIRWVERAFRRAGLFFVLVSPGPLVCTLARVLGMPPIRFVVTNLIGTIGLVFLVRFVGDAFSEPIEALIEFFEVHLTTVTAISVGMTVVGWLIWRRRARARLSRAGSDGRIVE
jgi:membrane protein DedA with SNARE-associated domain